MREESEGEKEGHGREVSHVYAQCKYTMPRTPVSVDRVNIYIRHRRVNEVDPRLAVSLL